MTDQPREKLSMKLSRDPRIKDRYNIVKKNNDNDLSVVKDKKNRIQNKKKPPKKDNTYIKVSSIKDVLKGTKLVIIPCVVEKSLFINDK